MAKPLKPLQIQSGTNSDKISQNTLSPIPSSVTITPPSSPEISNRVKPSAPPYELVKDHPKPSAPPYELVKEHPKPSAPPENFSDKMQQKKINFNQWGDKAQAKMQQKKINFNALGDKAQAKLQGLLKNNKSVGKVTSVTQQMGGPTSTPTSPSKNKIQR